MPETAAARRGSRRVRLVAAIVLTLAGALALGACGQSSGGASSGASSAVPATPVTPVASSSAIVTGAGDPNAQKFVVDPSSGYWSPDTLHATAGKPIEITFKQGTYECANGFTFSAFGLDSAVDLTKGPVTIHSDGLAAGTYPWLCSMQAMCGGKLIVQ